MPEWPWTSRLSARFWTAAVLCRFSRGGGNENRIIQPGNAHAAQSGAAAHAVQDAAAQFEGTLCVLGDLESRFSDLRFTDAAPLR